MAASKAAIAPSRVRAPLSEQEPEVAGKKFPSYMYVEFLCRYPTASVAAFILPCIVIMFMGVAVTTTVNASSEGFRLKDHESVHHYAANEMHTDAWGSTTREDNLAAKPEVYGSSDFTDARESVKYRVELQFELDVPRAQDYFSNRSSGGSLPELDLLTSPTMFEAGHPGHIEYIRKVEDVLKRSKLYTTLCFNNVFSDTCSPLTSLVTYFYPEVHFINAEARWELNGRGAVPQVPSFEVRNRIRANPDWEWFTGKGDRNGEVRLLRTHVLFGSPVLDRDGTEISEARHRHNLQLLINDFLRMFNEVSPHPYIVFTIGGDQVEEARVVNELDKEYWRVPLAALVVIVLIYLHCRTGVVTVCATVQLLLTFMVANGLMAFITKEVPLLSNISLYVVVAFGMDGTMVYYDTFLHSGIMSTTGRRNTLTVPQRMSYTLRKAGLGTVTANLAALAAFIAASQSPFPAVSEFAVVLILISVTNIYMALTYTPAFLLFHHYYFSKRRRNLQRQREIMMERAANQSRHPAMQLVLMCHNMFPYPGEKAYREIKLAGEVISDLQELEDELKNATLPAQMALRNEVRNVMDMVRNRGKKGGDGGREAGPGEEEEFDENAFATVGGTQKSFAELGENGGLQGPAANGGPIPYQSPRMVPYCDVYHIPPSSCFRSEATFEYLRQLSGAMGTPAPAVPPPIVPPNASAGNQNGAGHLEGIHTGSSLEPPPPSPQMEALEPTVDDIEEDDIGATVGESSGQYNGNGNGRHRDSNGVDSFAADAEMEDITGLGLAGDGDGADEEERKRKKKKNRGLDDDGRPRLVHPMPDPDDIDDEMLEEFTSDWVMAAEGLDVLEGDGPSAALKPLIGHYVCASLDPDHVVGESGLHRLYGVHRGSPQPAATGGFVSAPLPKETEDPVASSQQQAAARSRNPCTRVQNWWEERGKVKRKWCFGRFGQRVGETPEEKNARIMAKKIKHEGYTKFERFLLNTWAPLIHLLRYGIVIVAIVLLIVFGVFAGMLKPTSSTQTVLEDDELYPRYLRNHDRFEWGGNCDFCSGFYQPVDQYYSADINTWNLCNAQRVAAPAMMYARVNECGECNQPSCIDCNGVPNGTATVNTCSECIAAGASSATCGVCNSPAECGWCGYFSNATPRLANLPSGYGPFCNAQCSQETCPPNRGKCDPYTGVCRCHQDPQLGYFTGANCSVCLPGFFPPTNAGALRGECTLECINSKFTGGTAYGGQNFTCDSCVGTGRCSGCPAYTYGSDCDTQEANVCNGGTWTPSGCVCPPDTADGGQCQLHKTCNFRGRLITTATGPFEGCGCVGNWMGPKCEFCRCFNGGECNAKGECVCKGAWSGPLCTACPSTCNLRGNCPTPWTPDQYDMVTCAAIFCSREEVLDGSICATCKRTALITPECQVHDGSAVNGGVINSSSTAQEACNADDRCHWAQGTGNVSRCFSIYPRLNGTSCFVTVDDMCYGSSSASDNIDSNCLCRNPWVGDLCEVCMPPVNGLQCLDDGRVVGCDGVAVEINGGTSYRVNDRCGVCGGNNVCVGCDGVQGSSARFDSCGICGGKDACLFGQGSVVYPTIEHMVGLNSDYTINEEIDFNLGSTQTEFVSVCNYYTGGLSTLMKDIVRDVRGCPVFDFHVWSSLQKNTPTADYYIELTAEAEYTITNDHPNATELLFAWATDYGKLSSLGFNTASPRAKLQPGEKRRLRWMKLISTSKHATGTEPKYFEAERQQILDAARNPTSFATQVVILKRLSLASDAYVEAASQLTSIDSIRYTTGVGYACFVVVVAVLSCSVSLTVSAAFSVLLTMLGTFAVIVWADWNAGPTEQIGVALLVGMSAQHVVHLLEGYLSTVQSSQSNLFARQISVLNAVKGGLVRSGRSVVFSTIAVTVVSLIFIPSQITAFARSAELIIVINVFSMVSTLVVLPGVLSVIGVTQSFRHWSLSLVFCFVLGVTAGVIVLIIFIAGGVNGPKGTKVP